MNHKRGKPKSARSGCLLCKPHKHQAEHKAERTRRERAAMKTERLANLGQ